MDVLCVSYSHTSRVPTHPMTQECAEVGRCGWSFGARDRHRAFVLSSALPLPASSLSRCPTSGAPGIPAPVANGACTGPFLPRFACGSRSRPRWQGP
eukprot:scaffold30636_cov129-Isochrysis_galbana.AAC.5